MASCCLHEELGVVLHQAVRQQEPPRVQRRRRLPRHHQHEACFALGKVVEPAPSRLSEASSLLQAATLISVWHVRVGMHFTYRELAASWCLRRGVLVVLSHLPARAGAWRCSPSPAHKCSGSCRPGTARTPPPPPAAHTYNHGVIRRHSKSQGHLVVLAARSISLPKSCRHSQACMRCTDEGILLPLTVVKTGGSPSSPAAFVTAAAGVASLTTSMALASLPASQQQSGSATTACSWRAKALGDGRQR